MNFTSPLGGSYTVSLVEFHFVFLNLCRSFILLPASGLSPEIQKNADVSRGGFRIIENDFLFKNQGLLTLVQNITVTALG
jgi:hypothetical protein